MKRHVKRCVRNTLHCISKNMVTLTFKSIKNRFVVKELVVITQQILFVLRYLTDNYSPTRLQQRFALQ
jgi:hypothetical protein